MATTLTRQELLAREGCPWAKRTPEELYLGINDHLADFGFAFGHGEFNREDLEEVYLGPDTSPLAKAIRETEQIKDCFEVRVHSGLQDLISRTMGENPATSWGGWAWDVVHMSDASCSWEFASGEVLYGMSIGNETVWLVSGLMDPGMWCKGEGWITFALAEDVLPNPVPGRDGGFEGISYDSITARAFGTSESEEGDYFE